MLGKPVLTLIGVFVQLSRIMLRDICICSVVVLWQEPSAITAPAELV